MKQYFKWIVIKLIGLVALFCSTYSSAEVLPGIDVTLSQNFEVLANKRVGLITNHTGHCANGVSTIDILSHVHNVHLIALFSPEHGIRGDSDNSVSSGFDEKTGLPIYSLYGISCRPTGEMLQNIDVLVFDIQDIGTRFYTYIGTLSLAMQAARDYKIPFVVLDRPNPIGGEKVQGAIPATELPELKNGCGSITSVHPIPTRHGMTVGELAQFFNTEYKIGCMLKVIPMQGWQRSMYYDQTGLTWIIPSPNIKNLNAAILYPGLGILETTNISVGRGTDSPFEIYGAPWVDAAAMLRNLKERKLYGVSFARAQFVPTAEEYPYYGKICYGIKVEITDRDKFDPILTGLHLVQAFYETHPHCFKANEGFSTEVGDKDAWELLTNKKMSPDDMVCRWEKNIQHFKELRKSYLLY